MRLLLFILVAFVALTALTSGLLLVYNPTGRLLGLSPGLLQTTPFKTFLIPGILLAALVGGSNLVAVFFELLHTGRAYRWTLAGGALLAVWVVLQMLLIPSYYWLYSLYLLIGILIILISYQLIGKAIF